MSVVEYESAESRVTREFDPAWTNIESFGRSCAGGPRQNQDAFYTPSQGFHFAQFRKDDDSEDTRMQGVVQALNQITSSDPDFLGVDHVTPEYIRQTDADLVQLIKDGRLASLNIVCDGMGGDKEGEVASSLTVFAIVSEIVRQYDANEEKNAKLVMHEAIAKANELVSAFAKNRQQERGEVGQYFSGSTVVLHLADHIGVNHIASLGDSRAYAAYNADKNLTWSRVTVDHTNFENDLSLGLAKIEEFFRKKRDDIVFSAYVGMNNFDPEKFFYKNVTRSNSLIVLCSDGVWQGFDRSLISTLDFERMFFIRGLDSGSDSKKARAISNFWGEHFKKYVLEDFASTEAENLANYLTGEEIGRRSADNTTAIVIATTG